MAEVVEYRVGRTLDELNLLVEFGLFSKKHAKDIVSKRENFEYTLRRRTRTKLDFLKYIRFEVNLLQSIDNYRKVVLKENSKPKKDATESDEIDRKILILQAKKLNDIIRSRCAHVSALFRKLTTTFQFDKSLWLAYISFAKSRKWNTRTTALYWRLLRVCNDDPEIWLAAALHEVQVNKAHGTARNLFLRALRHHPQNSRLWSEYFKMELDYMDIVDRRSRVIFKTLDKLAKDKKDEAALWAEDLETTPTEGEAGIGDDDNDEDVQESESTVLNDDKDKLPDITPIEDDAIVSGQLPRIVFNNATDGITDIDLYNEFLIRILAYLCNYHTESKGFLSVQNDIISCIKRRYQDKDPRISKELYNGCQNKTYLEESLDGLSSDSQKEDGSSKKLKKAEPSRMEKLYECYETSGIEEARKLFQDLNRLPINRTLSLYVGMIQVEMWHLAKESPANQQDRVRDIYEKALLKFGKTKAKLWYEYIRFEMESSNCLDDVLKVNQLYQRAQATLAPDKVDKVIEKYVMLQAKSKSKDDLEHSEYSDLDD